MRPDQFRMSFDKQNIFGRFFPSRAQRRDHRVEFGLAVVSILGYVREKSNLLIVWRSRESLEAAFRRFQRYDLDALGNTVPELSVDAPCNVQP